MEINNKKIIFIPYFILFHYASFAAGFNYECALCGSNYNLYGLSGKDHCNRGAGQFQKVFSPMKAVIKNHPF